MKMVKYLYAFLITLMLTSCQSEKSKNVVPEPHLELGQKVTFVGGNLESDYVIVGYKSDYAGKIEKHWRDQDYIVFIYTNAQNDIKEGTVHVNSVVKK